MTEQLTRREVIVRSLWAAPGLLSLLPSPAFAEDDAARLAALEKTHGGRLGIAVLDVATGRRGDDDSRTERAGLCGEDDEADEQLHVRFRSGKPQRQARHEDDQSWLHSRTAPHRAGARGADPGCDANLYHRTVPPSIAW